jgi:hypothetical protein
LDYITNLVSEIVKDLRIISDRCSGQNRNHAVVKFPATLVANGRFNEVFQYFPVRGHFGRDFGIGKNVLHETSRVYTPEEYHKLIEQSSRKGSFQ